MRLHHQRDYGLRLSRSGVFVEGTSLHSARHAGPVGWADRIRA